MLASRAPTARRRHTHDRLHYEHAHVAIVTHRRAIGDVARSPVRWIVSPASPSKRATAAYAEQCAHHRWARALSRTRRRAEWRRRASTHKLSDGPDMGGEGGARLTNELQPPPRCSCRAPPLPAHHRPCACGRAVGRAFGRRAGEAHGMWHNVGAML